MKITSFLFLNVYWLYFSFRHLLWQFNHADRFVELVTITWTSENTFTLGIRILKSLSNFSIDQNPSQYKEVSIHYSIPNGSLTIENAMTLLSTKIKCVLSCTHYLQLDSVIFKFFTKKNWKICWSYKMKLRVIWIFSEWISFELTLHLTTN